MANLGDALKFVCFPPGNSNFHFPPIFLKSWPKPPGESKTRCGDSRGTDMSPIQANLTDFVICFICSKVQKKMTQKWNIFQLFPNAPAPRHPETLPPSKSSSWRCRGTKFHPDWTKWRPSYAHLKFRQNWKKIFESTAQWRSIFGESV